MLLSLVKLSLRSGYERGHFIFFVAPKAFYLGNVFNYVIGVQCWYSFPLSSCLLYYTACHTSWYVLTAAIGNAQSVNGSLGNEVPLYCSVWNSLEKFLSTPDMPVHQKIFLESHKLFLSKLCHVIHLAQKLCFWCFYYLIIGIILNSLFSKRKREYLKDWGYVCHSYSVVVKSYFEF